MGSDPPLGWEGLNDPEVGAGSGPVLGVFSPPSLLHIPRLQGVPPAFVRPRPRPPLRGNLTE